jgi:hypothetical protein
MICYNIHVRRIWKIPVVLGKRKICQTIISPFVSFFIPRLHKNFLFRVKNIGKDRNFGKCI